jgi:hypothetical protein
MARALRFSMHKEPLFQKYGSTGAGKGIGAADRQSWKDHTQGGYNSMIQEAQGRGEFMRQALGLSDDVVSNVFSLAMGGGDADRWRETLNMGNPWADPATRTVSGAVGVEEEMARRHPDGM